MKIQFIIQSCLMILSITLKMKLHVHNRNPTSQAEAAQAQGSTKAGKLTVLSYFSLSASAFVQFSISWSLSLFAYWLSRIILCNQLCPNWKRSPERWKPKQRNLGCMPASTWAGQCGTIVCLSTWSGSNVERNERRKRVITAVTTMISC